jgi:two-component system sensor histidine kinase ChvG
LPPDHLAISAAAPIKPIHQLYGSVMLLSKNDQINRTIHALRLNILSAFVTALLFSVTMSLILARRLAHPLSQLAFAARRFDRLDSSLSDLEIPIVKTPHDEIGALSRAMAQMVESLKWRINSIEGFAGDVAHEIRNPIAAVKSVLETLPLIRCEEKRQEFLSMAQAELNRLDWLISDILEATRLDTALQDEQREAMDITDAIRRFVENYRALYPQQRLNVCLPQRVLWVFMQERRIDQIMQNLLDNARDFAPEDTDIVVTLTHRAERAAVTIADEGIGIPQAALDKVFNRFYSDREGGKKGNHTGLGLSIVRQIVESHSGVISAANQPPPKSGAVITVDLPLHSEIGETL